MGPSDLLALAPLAMAALCQAGAGGFPLTPVHGSYWIIDEDDGEERQLACLLFFEGAPGWLETVEGYGMGAVGDGVGLELTVAGRVLEVGFDPKKKSVQMFGESFGLRADNVFLIKGADGEAPSAVGLGRHDLVVPSDKLAVEAVMQRDAPLRCALTGDPLPAPEEERDVGARRQWQQAVALLDKENAPDDRRAVRLLREAAKSGLGEAQYTLGWCCLHGRGIAEDPVEANRLLLLAAEQGVINAQFVLADSYRMGRGVDADAAKAIAWLEKAADQGDAEAMASLAYIYDTGEGVDTDKEKAFEWYRRAAEAGELWSEYQMASRYRERGDPESLATAYEWIRGLEWQLTFIPPGERHRITELADELRPKVPEEDRRAAEERARQRVVRHAAMKIRRMGR